MLKKCGPGLIAGAAMLALCRAAYAFSFGGFGGLPGSQVTKLNREYEQRQQYHPYQTERAHERRSKGARRRQSD